MPSYGERAVREALYAWYGGSSQRRMHSAFIEALSPAGIKPDTPRSSEILECEIRAGLLKDRIEVLLKPYSISYEDVLQGLESWRTQDLVQIQRLVDDAKVNTELHATEQFQQFFKWSHKNPLDVARSLNYLTKDGNPREDMTEQQRWFMEYVKQWVDDQCSLYGAMREVTVDEQDAASLNMYTLTRQNEADALRHITAYLVVQSDDSLRSIVPEKYVLSHEDVDTRPTMH